MSTRDYDAIVVGARCAGSPTAMLLARAGARVLLVDQASFPSDTLSTHVIHPPGVAALRRWGLAERVEATGCPRLPWYSFDFGPVTIAGHPRPFDGIGYAVCPRRTVLDEILVRAAADAGAEVRERFRVDEVLIEDGVARGIRGHAQGGAPVTERARVVIGADGRHSQVAKAVRPAQYGERPARMACYYAYWRDLPAGGFETVIRAEQHRGWAVAPTNDGLTLMVFAWPMAEFRANRSDVERHLWETVELAPAFAERLHGATLTSRFAGTADLAGWFRTPYGPGWALVGDAGYHKNPITAMGIHDAFRDAELLSAALLDAWAGRRSLEDGMRAYQATRDREAMPMYEFTDDLAQLQPPPPELQQLIGAMAGNQEAMDGFVSVQAATMPLPEFFAPANVGRIMGAAKAAH